MPLDCIVSRHIAKAHAHNLHAVSCCMDDLSAPVCIHVRPCAGTQCDKLLDEVYDDLKDINLYDILWTCYHGGRPRQQALMQVTASLTHHTSLLLSSNGGSTLVPCATTKAVFNHRLWTNRV